MGAAHKLVDKDILRSLVPLNALSETHFNELIKKAKIEELSSGYYLFKKGERDNQSIYVLDGEVALLQGRKEKSFVFSGTEVALHPIASQQPRQFTARTKGRTTIMRVDSGLLDVMLTWDQSSGSSYEVNELHSEEDEDWMTRMLQSELLLKLPAQNLQQLIMRMEELEAKSGETVVEQDGKGDFYYIIKAGTCVVARKLSERGKPIKLAELNEGDSFGEEALLSGGKRNASIIMKTDGILMRLAKKDFDELLKDPLLDQVTYKQGCNVVKEGGVWLDVRLPGEYENGHLPGSINIPLAAIRDETAQLDVDTKYVMYCDTGRRSSSAIFLLGQSGFDGSILKDGLASVPHDELETSTVIESKNLYAPDVPVNHADVIPFNQARSKPDLIIKDQTPAVNQKAFDDNQQKITRILQDQLDGLKHELIKREEEISVLRTELRTDTEENTQHQNEAARLHGELENALGKVSDLEAQLMESRSSSDGFKDDLSGLARRMGDEAHEHQAALEKLGNTEQKMQQYQQENDELQQYMKQIQDEMTALSMRLQEEESIRQVLEKTSESLRQDRDHLEQDKQHQTENLEKESFVFQAKLEEQKEARQQAEQQLASKAQEAHEYQEALGLVEKEIAGLKSDQEEYALSQEAVEVERSKRVGLEEQLVSLEKESSQKIKEFESSGTLSETEIANLRSQLEEALDAHKNLGEESEARREVEQKLESVEQESREVGKTLERAEAELANYEVRLAELVGVQKNLEDERKERTSLEAKLECLDQDAVKIQESLELANEEIASQRLKQEDASAEIADYEEKLSELIGVQKDLEAEREERTSLEAKLECLEQEAVETQKSLELVNEEVDSQRLKQEEVLQVQEHLDKECEVRQKAEQALEALKQEWLRNEDVLGKATKELDELHEELEKSGQEKDSSITKLEDENKALLYQVEKISNEANEIERQYQKDQDSWQSTEQEFGIFKQDTEILTQQLKEVTLGKSKLEEQISVIKEENKGSNKAEKAAREQAEDEIHRLEQELEKMKGKEEQYKKTENDLEGALDKLTADLRQAHARVDDLDMKLGMSQNNQKESHKEMDKLGKELGQSGGIIEEAKALRDEMEELKRIMEEERKEGNINESIKETAQQDESLKDENEILRKELEKIYRDQEIAIEIGRAPTPPKPLDIPNLLGAEAKSDDASISASAGAAESAQQEGRYQNDPFAVADLDKQLFKAKQEVSKKGKWWIIILILVAGIILGSAGVYWYFKQPESDRGPGKVADKRVAPVVQETAKPVRKKIPRKVEPKIEKKIITIKKKVIAKPVQAAKKPVSRKSHIQPKPEVKLMSAGKTYSDPLTIGVQGPVMVKVKKGEFEMGSAFGSTDFDERPTHIVKLKAFSISMYEVTFDEYEQFSEAEGLARPDDHGWGRGNRPVINVSWSDAAAYAKWLSEQSGHHYRLPTEAEWEYAARAGSSTQYWWGALIKENIANCFNCGSQWDGQGTASVGSFQPNALGLYDVTGNVMEWTQDCYHKNYKGAPVNGKAWESADCVNKMVRGGSYRTTALNLRSSKRDHLHQDIYADNVGFRLVRE